MLTNECRQLSQYVERKIEENKKITLNRNIPEETASICFGRIQAYQDVLKQIKEIHEGLLNGAE